MSKFGGIPVNDISRFESAISGAAQEATLGFADEAFAGVAAGAQRLAGVLGAESVRGKSIGDLYKQNLDRYRAEDVAAYKANPASYIGGAVGGALLPVNAGRLAKGLGKGAAYATAGGVSALGHSEGDTLGEVATDTSIGALGGAVLGPLAEKAVSGVGRVGEEVVKKITGKAARTLTPEQVGQMAGVAYKTAESKGGTLSPKLVNKFADDIANIAPQTEAGKLFSGNTKFTEAAAAVNRLRDKPLTLKAAQEIDEGLSGLIDLAKDGGMMTKDATNVLKIQKALRATIDNAADSDIIGGKEGFEALKAGRALWRRSAKLRDIDNILRAAEVSDNPATTIKNGFSGIYKDKSLFNGYSKQEQRLIKEAATRGVVGDALRTFGSRLVPIVAGSAGGPGAGAAGTVASIASRDAASRLQAGRAARVMQEISSPGSTATPISDAVSAVAGDAAAKLSGNMGIERPSFTTPEDVEVQPAPQSTGGRFGGIPVEGQPQPSPSPVSSIQGIPEVERALVSAASVTGVDPGVLYRIAKVESSLNPSAKAKTSSATGLFQMTRPTWRRMVKQHGAALGITLDDIADPEANAIMAGMLAKENQQRLENALNRPIDAGELYVAHFMGGAGAQKLLTANPDARAAKLFPRAAEANRSIFYDGKRSRKVGEVVSLLKNKVARVEAPIERLQAVQNIPMLNNVPMEAISMLMSQPDLANDFDAKYGSGAAQAAMQFYGG